MSEGIDVLCRAPASQPTNGSPVTVTDTVPVGLTPTGPVGAHNGCNWAINGQTLTCKRSDVDNSFYQRRARTIDSIARTTISHPVERSA